MSEDLKKHISLSLPRISTICFSSDNIPIKLRVSPTLLTLRAEKIITWPIDKTFAALPTRSSPKYVYTSKTHAIKSSDRLGEVEEILQRRIVRAQGLRVKRVKQYLIR